MQDPVEAIWILAALATRLVKATPNTHKAIRRHGSMDASMPSHVCIVGVGVLVVSLLVLPVLSIRPPAPPVSLLWAARLDPSHRRRTFAAQPPAPAPLHLGRVQVSDERKESLR